MVKISRSAAVPFQTMQVSDVGRQLLQAVMDGDSLRLHTKENRAEWDTLLALGLLSFDDKQFDMVVTRAGMLHLHNQEARNVLAQGG